MDINDAIEMYRSYFALPQTEKKRIVMANLDGLHIDPIDLLVELFSKAQQIGYNSLVDKGTRAKKDYAADMTNFMQYMIEMATNIGLANQFMKDDTASKED